MLHAVDDEHVHWPFGSLNFETKLLLQRRNERRTVGIDRRNAGRRRVGTQTISALSSRAGFANLARLRAFCFVRAAPARLAHARQGGAIFPLAITYPA